MSPERLTKRNSVGFAEAVKQPECFIANTPVHYMQERAIKQECLERLAEYEDLKENNLLAILPCKIGDFIYLIYFNRSGKSIIEEEIVRFFEINKDEIIINASPIDDECKIYPRHLKDLGNWWFFNKEEAKSKVAEV